MIPVTYEFKKPVIKRERVHKPSTSHHYREASVHSYAEPDPKLVSEYEALLSDEEDKQMVSDVIATYAAIMDRVTLSSRDLASASPTLSATPHLELLEHLRKEEQRKARDLMLKAKIRAAKEQRERARNEESARANSAEVREIKKKEAERVKKSVEIRNRWRDEVKTKREKRVEEFEVGQKEVRSRRRTELAKIRQTSQI